ncbi:MAG: ATP-binding protein [Planctomycetota bacterium]
MKTISTAELAQRLAQDGGVSAEVISRVLTGVVKATKDEISRGNAVSIDGLFTLQISGKVAAKPSGKQIGAPPKRKINFTMDKDFRESIEGARTYSIVLCVPVSDMFTNIMVNSLSGPNSEVTIATGRDEAQQQIQSIKPDIVIADTTMPDVGDLIRFMKTDRGMPLTSTIFLYPEGGNPHAIKGLRILEDEQVSEPFEMEDLVGKAENQLQWIVSNRSKVRTNVHFKFQTKDDCVEAANALVSELLVDSGLSDEARDQLAVAYREAVDNSARHGNKNNPKRLIDSVIMNDGEKITIIVEDQGEGFDTEQYLIRGREGDAAAAARERAQQGRVGGLGIMLMLKCVSRLEYNFTGNKITLTKTISG